MSEEIIKVLDDLSARFGVAIDWGSEKALPALQVLFAKFIRYKIVTHSVGIAISVLLIAMCVYLIVTMAKDYRLCMGSGKNTCFWEYYGYRSNADASFVGLVSGITVIITFPASICACLYNIFNLIEAVMLPELYTMEYLINYTN